MSQTGTKMYLLHARAWQINWHQIRFNSPTYHVRTENKLSTMSVFLKYWFAEKMWLPIGGTLFVVSIYFASRGYRREGTKSPIVECFSQAPSFAGLLLGLGKSVEKHLL